MTCVMEAYKAVVFLLILSDQICAAPLRFFQKNNGNGESIHISKRMSGLDDETLDNVPVDSGRPFTAAKRSSETRRRDDKQGERIWNEEYSNSLDEEEEEPEGAPGRLESNAITKRKIPTMEDGTLGLRRLERAKLSGQEKVKLSPKVTLSPSSSTTKPSSGSITSQQQETASETITPISTTEGFLPRAWNKIKSFFSRDNSTSQPEVITSVTSEAASSKTKRENPSVLRTQKRKASIHRVSHNTGRKPFTAAKLLHGKITRHTEPPIELTYNTPATKKCEDGQDESGADEPSEMQGGKETTVKFVEGENDKFVGRQYIDKALPSQKENQLNPYHALHQGKRNHENKKKASESMPLMTKGKTNMEVENAGRESKGNSILVEPNREQKDEQEHQHLDKESKMKETNKKIVKIKPDLIVEEIIDKIEKKDELSESDDVENQKFSPSKAGSSLPQLPTALPNFPSETDVTEGPFFTGQSGIGPSTSFPEIETKVQSLLVSTIETADAVTAEVNAYENSSSADVLEEQANTVIGAEWAGTIENELSQNLTGLTDGNEDGTYLPDGLIPTTEETAEENTKRIVSGEVPLQQGSELTSNEVPNMAAAIYTKQNKENELQSIIPEDSSISPEISETEYSKSALNLSPQDQSLKEETASEKATASVSNLVIEKDKESFLEEKVKIVEEEDREVLNAANTFTYSAESSISGHSTESIFDVSSGRDATENEEVADKTAGFDVGNELSTRITGLSKNEDIVPIDVAAYQAKTPLSSSPTMEKFNERNSDETHAVNRPGHLAKHSNNASQEKDLVNFEDAHLKENPHELPKSSKSNKRNEKHPAVSLQLQNPPEDRQMKAYHISPKEEVKFEKHMKQMSVRPEKSAKEPHDWRRKDLESVVRPILLELLENMQEKRSPHHMKDD